MARPKSNRPTRRVDLYLYEDAADLLDKLAGSQRKRGEYVSEMIYQAAQGAGLPVRTAAEFDLAALHEQLRSLQERVTKALEQQHAN